MSGIDPTLRPAAATGTTTTTGSAGSVPQPVQPSPAVTAPLPATPSYQYQPVGQPSKPVATSDPLAVEFTPPTRTRGPRTAPPARVTIAQIPQILSTRIEAVAAQQKADGLWQAEYLAAPMHGAYASLASNLIGDAQPGAAARDKQLMLSLIGSQQANGSFPAYPGGPASRSNTRLVILALKVALEHNPELAKDPQARQRLGQAEAKARAFVQSQQPSDENVLNTMMAESMWHAVAPDDPMADDGNDPAGGRLDFSERLLAGSMKAGPFYSVVEAEAFMHDPDFAAARNTLSQPLQVAIAAGAVLNDGAFGTSGVRQVAEKLMGTGKDHAASLAALKRDILAGQDGNGGWLYMGAMTAANLLALKKLGVPASDPVMQKGLHFLSDLQQPDGRGGLRQSFSNGVIWDSAMAGAAMLRNGVRGDDPRIVKAIDKLLPEQHNGRWSFATNSQHGMENDTTNVTMTFLALAYPTASPAQKPKIQAAIQKAAEALLKNQQADGGWNAWLPTPWKFGDDMPGAFEATAMDASTADVTGRVTTALSTVSRSGAVGGLTKVRIEAAKAKAVGYLRQSKTDSGWWSRWMIGYVTTGGWAVPALRLSGVKPNDPVIRDQRAFLLKHQNANGGFGETAAADQDPDLAGKGRSTPAQTALALVSLIASSPTDDIRQDPQIGKAVEYLLNPGPGDDQVAVYTANPGVEYYQSEWQLVPTALRLYEDAVTHGVAKALDRYVSPAAKN